MKKRSDLRIIISSATLDAKSFETFFKTSDPNSCVTVSIEGRMFPVDVLYLKSPCPNYIERVVDCVMAIHQYESEGDILVFLTGKEDIETAISLINEHMEM
jgi:ATP-dependent RNA helicase DDX35